MSLAAGIQITDQDVYQQSSVIGAENIGQLATTPSGKTFAYASAGGAITAGQITQPAAVTANYATRTLSIAVAQGANQVSVTLGTTAAQDAFKGYWLVVTDGTGAGQGSYYINGNTAATAGNSNTTILGIDNAVNIALDTTSVVGIYPSQQSAVIQHTTSAAIPTSGAPVINITSGFYFWNQVGGYASILSAATVASKNADAIPGTTAGAVVIYDGTATATQPVGYAPELMVATKYSPLVLTIAG